MEELFGWNTTEIFYYIICPPGEFLFFHFLVPLFFLLILYFTSPIASDDTTSSTNASERTGHLSPSEETMRREMRWLDPLRTKDTKKKGFPFLPSCVKWQEEIILSACLTGRECSASDHRDTSRKKLCQPEEISDGIGGIRNTRA